MESLFSHWFWAGITAAALFWYATITVYVAIRAVMDIRQMLNHLRARQERNRQSG